MMNNESRNSYIMNNAKLASVWTGPFSYSKYERINQEIKEDDRSWWDTMGNYPK